MKSIATLYRGQEVESEHFGTVAVTDSQGKVQAKFGDLSMKTYLRSTAKPYQAYSFVKNGGIKELNISQRELAIFCASHSAEKQHTELVNSFLSRIGFSISDLQCGAHPPMNEEEAERLARKNVIYTDIHNNCSGKHSGMLAQIKLFNADPKTYLSLDNPIQQKIFDTISDFSGIPKEEISTSVDGCSAPIFYLPIDKFSHLYGMLAEGADEHLAQLRDAMTSFPFLIAGTGRFDTDFMTAMNGRFVSKTGAEGVQCIGVIDGGPRPECKGWGITVKISDGHKRAKGPAAIEALAQLGLLTNDEIKKLENHYHPVQKNWAGKVVGKLMPEYKLET